LSPNETKGHRMGNTMDALFIFLGRQPQLKEGVLRSVLDWHMSIV
jgi:hypothetical protein